MTYVHAMLLHMPVRGCANASGDGMQVMGLVLGLLTGTFTHAAALVILWLRTDWDAEARLAAVRAEIKSEVAHDESADGLDAESGWLLSSSLEQQDVGLKVQGLDGIASVSALRQPHPGNAASQ